MSTTRNDFYAILDIKSDADHSAIRKAFIKQILKFHPDKYKDDSDFAKAKTQAIVEAYRILSNPREKQIYDLSSDLPSNESIDNTKAPFESKQMEDHFSFKGERAKFKRDPNAKPDPNFNYTEFYSVITAMFLHGQGEFITDYIIQNILDLERNIQGHKIIDVFNFRFTKDVCDLVTMLPSAWLKKPENFGSYNVLAIFISNHLPIENWKVFLDHLGQNWLQDFVKVKILCILGYFTGSIAENSTEYRQLQVDTFFNYLGQEWLRKTFRHSSNLGEFLCSDGTRSDKDTLLRLLDGNTGWLKENFTNGSDLGYILDRMSKYFGTREMFLSLDIEEAWESFLKYLDPDWKQKIINNRVEFNALLNQLDGLDRTLKFELFLNKYFDKKTISNLEDLIAVLMPQPEQKLEEESIQALSVHKSLQFIQIFSDQEILTIMRGKRVAFSGNQPLFKQNSTEWFSEALKSIDQHQKQPFYRSLLFALARAHHDERDQNPAENVSRWGGLVGCTRSEELLASRSLMGSILKNKPIEKMKGMTGKLNDIKTRYDQSRKLVKKEEARSSVLLLK